MSIRWDPILARETARELERALAGEDLRALRLDGEARDLLLLFRTRTLVWRLHPTRGHLSLRPPVDPVASDLTHRARVRRVVAPPDERLVRFELLPRRGGVPHDIVVELLGNQWNAVVLEAPTGTVRHVLWSRGTGRGHRVGERWAFPAAPLRQGVGATLSVADWLALLEPLAPEDRTRALVRNVAWTAPLTAPFFLGLDLDAPERDRLEEGHARWLRLAAGQGPTRPVVLDLDTGAQPYPYALADIPSHPAATLLDAFESVSAETGRDTTVALVDPDLVRRLEREVDRLRRRTRVLERELGDLADSEEVRGIGDLILARYGEIPAGAAEAVLTGFDGNEVRVTLDPSRAPHENAADRYEEAARIERARERLPGLVARAAADRDRLEDLLERARRDAATPDELRAALPEAPDAASVRGPAARTLPYRVYRSSGGLEIRVGRGAAHNDALTFRHSAPNDVWLHARQVGGAHVVLRWPGPGNPPARDLTEAAVLAALHSKARTSGSAPVDWTLRKYVRKPRGAAKGSVVADRVSTLFVHPDPGVEETLRVE